MVRIHLDPPHAILRFVRNCRGISSAGRAPALQAGGRRFEPVILHHASAVVYGARSRAQTQGHGAAMGPGVVLCLGGIGASVWGAAGCSCAEDQYSCSLTIWKKHNNVEVSSQGCCGRVGLCFTGCDCKINSSRNSRHCLRAGFSPVVFGGGRCWQVVLCEIERHKHANSSSCICKVMGSSE